MQRCYLCGKTSEAPAVVCGVPAPFVFDDVCAACLDVESLVELGDDAKRFLVSVGLKLAAALEYPREPSERKSGCCNGCCSCSG